MPDGFPVSDPVEDNAQAITRRCIEALRPPAPLDVLDWTETHRRFPEGSPLKGKFRRETAPYLDAIFQACNPDNGVELVVVPKCAQSGGSVVAESFIGAVGSEVGEPGMVVHPTIEAAKKWARKKFEGMAKATTRLKGAAIGAYMLRTAREVGGSKADLLKFRGRSEFVLVGANSEAGFRQDTICWVVEDDLDGFPEEVTKQDGTAGGDPETLADQRQKTYKKQGRSKRIKISTPLLKRSSRVVRAYEKTVKNRFYMACREETCQAKVDWDWEDLQGKEKGDDGADAPYLTCPCCGTVHEDKHKRAMIAGGVWVPTAARFEGDETPPKAILPDDLPQWLNRDMGRLAASQGFWITGIMNVFSTFLGLVEAYRDALGDEARLKAFYNTELGRPYEVVTETPDWEKLSAVRTVDFHRGQGHPGALVFVLTVDVQRDGLYFRIIGYGLNQCQFTLDWGFLAGKTEDAGEGAWEALTKIARRGAPLPGGAYFDFDGIAVDTKFHTDAAKAFVKATPKTIAINGASGWRMPIIYRAEQVELRKSGAKKRFAGMKIWHVGTYDIKKILVARYNDTIKGPSETGQLPRGFQVWPAEADEDFFRQITSEAVREKVNKQTGRSSFDWVQLVKDNHYFDLDVYGLALLEYLRMRHGIPGHWDDDDFARRAELLAELTREAQGDLFVPRAKAEAKADTTTQSRWARLGALGRGEQ